MSKLAINAWANRSLALTGLGSAEGRTAPVPPAQMIVHPRCRRVGVNQRSVTPPATSWKPMLRNQEAHRVVDAAQGMSESLNTTWRERQVPHRGRTSMLQD